MHDRVHQAEVNCEKSIKEHQRRTAEIEQKFKEKEIYLQDQLRKQMQRVIEEQAREIEDVQNEFS
jgi:hypothetical protein